MPHVKVARPLYAIACYQPDDGSPSSCGGPKPCTASNWKELLGCLI